MSATRPPGRALVGRAVERTAGAVWSGVERAGAADAVRRRYLTARSIPNGWRRRVTVEGITATMATRTWPEYVRVSTLHGERRAIASFLRDCRPDDVVWDVGANVGLYACLAARCVPRGRVEAIEPEPANARRLRGNLLANAPTERWRVHPVALGDVDGPAVLETEHPPAARVPGSGHHFLRGDDGLVAVDGRGRRTAERTVTGSADTTVSPRTDGDGGTDRGGRPDGGGPSAAARPVAGPELDGEPWTGATDRPELEQWTGDTIAVTQRRADSLIAANAAPVPDLLKVDVQGAELPVLRGFGDRLEAVRRVTVEVHTDQCSRYGATVAALRSLLSEHGFELTDGGRPSDDRSTVRFLEARQ